jgi:hypothetical protein
MIGGEISLLQHPFEVTIAAYIPQITSGHTEARYQAGSDAIKSITSIVDKLYL